MLLEEELDIEVILYSVLVLYVIWCIYDRMRVAKKNRRYQSRIVEYMTQRNKKLEQFKSKYRNSISEEIQQKILKSSATELMSLLKKLVVTSQQIVITYGLRIVEQGRVLNAVADVDLEKALQEAEQRDKERQIANSLQKELPGLHGLPITIKDHICTQGYIDTYGVAKNLYQLQQKEDSLFIEVLRKQGIIALAKSNIPVCCGVLESYNRIFGNTLNPWDYTRTAGGSSGGEAALICSGCSILGVGSDDGGSLRFPAAFTGIYSFMPTSTRISRIGIFEGNSKKFKNGLITTGGSLGPLGRNTQDLKLLIENVFGEFTEKDYYTNQNKFDQYIYTHIYTGQKKLKVAVMYSDEFIEAAPAIQNTLREVAKALSTYGHQVEEFPIKNLKEYTYYFFQMIYTNGAAGDILNALDDEYPPSSLSLSVNIHQIPQFLKSCSRVVLGLLKEKRLQYLFETTFNKKINKYQEFADQKEILKEEFNRVFRNNQYDVLLLPVSPCVAPKLNAIGDAGPIVNYAGLINLLQYCAGTVPIRKVLEHEQYYKTQWNQDSISKSLHTIMKNNTQGLPIGIQVAAPPNKDEVCLAAMKIIEDIFQFHELKL